MYETDWQVMICLQSTEEGEEAGVRRRVGQELLDLPKKFIEYMLAPLITKDGNIL